MSIQHFVELLQEGRIGVLRVGMSIDDVINVLGLPQGFNSIGQIHKLIEDNNLHLVLFGDIEIYVLNKQISTISIELEKQHISTSKFPQLNLT